MKQFIIMAVSLLSITVSVTAGTVTNEHSPIVTKTITAKAAFQHIVINGDVDVVLTEKDFVQVDVTGEQKAVEAVSHFVKRGTLYINRKYSAKTSKPVVYISVNDLNSIEVNGDGSITSRGVLRSSKLKVIVNGEAKFNLKNYGQILVEADEDIDLQFEKNGIEEKPITAIGPADASVTEADAIIDEQMIKSSYHTVCKS